MFSSDSCFIPSSKFVGHLFYSGMMKVALFCFLLSAFGTASILFNCSGKGMIIAGGNIETLKVTSRKLLQDNGLHPGFDDNGYGGDVNSEDYRPVDPSPSSKAVRPGPIQHSTPLMPYIPKPSPPNHPWHGSIP
ncbi:hypothetical protein Nepgr_005014 [Nepenthes gracilis]|uniref:Uncharacterized protein n=1 Tax=Nepenthes gracilis TaxID=150966 RepID=A0AAD3S2E0_NEPGR|nr:hypothetical protein Nepgr_005014 [Nepenthes gracilis]